jgi:fructosamine-3-kinase
VEAAGLRWLAEAALDGGARAESVVAEGPGWLETERVRTAGTAPGAAAAFGRRLALTHAAGAPSFGCAPPGWSGAGRIGAAPLPLREPTPRHPGAWGPFYATDRVLPYLRAAVDAGAMDPDGARVVERLASKLDDGDFDAPQPGLVRHAAARIHGDLWSGNVLWDADAGGEGVLIDPAAHGGHAETDLAMLLLFGQTCHEEILAGYTEVSPVAGGWRERIALHQLHPLLVHAVLFGGGYGASAARVAARYL